MERTVFSGLIAGWSSPEGWLSVRPSSRLGAPAFSELVEQVRKAGHLQRPLRYVYDLEVEDPNAFGTGAALLLSLKDHRKRAKHQGNDEAREWLAMHF